jgi:RimJ/RimL family protein N-acetyltransferase
VNNLTVLLKTPSHEDKEDFLNAVTESESLLDLWVQTPNSEVKFNEYIDRISQSNHEAYLVLDSENNLVGVYNITEIVRGCFQSAYLGFYAFEGFAGRGYMSAALKLVLSSIFNDLKLHRIEANIQPDNKKSINLVHSNGFINEGFSKNYLKVNNQWRDHERWAVTAEMYHDGNLTLV